jgi:ketosteroid isomerase-like protein
MKSLAFAGLILAFLLAVCPALARAQAPETPPGERVSKLADEFLRSYNEDFSKGDLDAWMEHWAENALRESSRNRWEGLAAIRRSYEDILRGMSENRLLNERVRLVQGNRFAWQGDYSARSRRTGRSVLVPIAIFLTFDDTGKIKHARFYLDNNFLNDQAEGRVSAR